MDVVQALAELTEISPQVEQAVVFGSGGEPVGSTLPADRAAALARYGSELFDAAARAGGAVHGGVTQVEIALAEASILLASKEELRILAVTGPDPISGLVFFELGMCLRKVAGAEPKKGPLSDLRAKLRSPLRGKGDDGTS